MRGTFANIRLRNKLVPGVEGGYTVHPSQSEAMPIFDAAMKYAAEGTPLLIVAGKEYGTGSSRDWAAKGTSLLGVKAVLAESFERIHRSNLVGMGVLPLQFMEGTSWKSLNLDGSEIFHIEGVENIGPGDILKVSAEQENKSKVEFEVIARRDTPVEVEYFKNGGILPYILRKNLTTRR